MNRAASLPSHDDDEWQGVMSGMRQDATFDVVTADLLIQVIGHDIWSSKQINKEREAKHKARRAMRRVARLKNAVIARTVHHWEHQGAGELDAAA